MNDRWWLQRMSEQRWAWAREAIRRARWHMNDGRHFQAKIMIESAMRWRQSAKDWRAKLNRRVESDLA